MTDISRTFGETFGLQIQVKERNDETRQEDLPFEVSEHQ